MEIVATSMGMLNKLNDGLRVPLGSEFCLSCFETIKSAASNRSNQLPRIQWIGEVVNLVAKLEKHTKAEQVRALTTASSYALALEQGYRPGEPSEFQAGRKIDGVTGPVDLVVLAR